MRFSLTEQQLDAIQYFPQVTPNNPLVVEARAGTGKSTLIEHGCRSNLQSRVLLLCFNKSIAEAAVKRMPANVTAKTFSGWTWNTPLSSTLPSGIQVDSTYGRVYGHRVKWRFDAKKLANLFRVETTMIYAARATLDFFVSTADQYITKYHVPKRLWIGKEKKEQEGFKDEVVGIARRIWRMKQEKSNKLVPTTWSDITKMVQVERDIQRTDNYEFVIVDEAQDITACVLDLILQKGSPTVMVGDSKQKLYDYLYMVDAMEKIGGMKKYLTESQRFDQRLANCANSVLDLLQGDFPKIIGNGPRTDISYETPVGKYTILCRTNMGLLSESLSEVRKGKKIHVMGNIMDAVKQLESGYYLSVGLPDNVTHPSLLGVKDWNEIEVMKESDADMALLYRQVTKYGSQIPGFCEELENSDQVAESNSDVVLSTVHKAKGREWDNVKMFSDFQKLVHFSEKDRRYKVNKNEVYTTYVAVTRAKKTLYPNDIIGQCKGWMELL